jgi:hypothetical protein
VFLVLYGVINPSRFIAIFILVFFRQETLESYISNHRVRVFLSMQQSEPDVHSLEERIALLERQSNLESQAFEYLTQLRLTSLTLEDEVGDGGALAEWKSDCEAHGISNDESSAPAEEKPVFRHKPKFRLPDYDTEVARPPHYKELYAPMLKAGGSAPAAGEGFSGTATEICRCKDCCALSPCGACARFSGPEYDPESEMPLRTAGAKLAAAISLLRKPSA